MDFSITKVHINSLNKEQALNLARDYQIQITPDQTLSDLRPKLSTVREVYKNAEKDEAFCEILKQFLDGEELPESVFQEYPQLSGLSKVLENSYETIVTQSYSTNSDSIATTTIHQPVYQNFETNKFGDNSTGNNFTENKQSQVLKTFPITTASATITVNSVLVTPPKNTVHNPQLDIFRNMAEVPKEKLPLVKPTSFSGQSHESVQEFLRKYELSARCNRWSDRTKLDLFCTYTSGVAYKWVTDFMDTRPEASWADLKSEFTKSFGHSGTTYDLQSTLDARVQCDNEKPVQFFFEIRDICRKIDPDMTDKQIITYTMKGLKPAYFDEVIRMDSNNLVQFQENLATIESREQLRSQNLRKHTLHQGFDVPYLSQQVGYDPSFNHSHVQRNVHFNTMHTQPAPVPAVQTPYAPPELLNVIKDISERMTKLEMRNDNNTSKPVLPSSPRREEYQSDSRHASYRSTSHGRFQGRNQSPSPYRERQHKYTSNHDSRSRAFSPAQHHNSRRGDGHHSDNFRYRSSKSPHSSRNSRYPHNNSGRQYNCSICKMDNHSVDQCSFNRKRSFTPQRGQQPFIPPFPGRFPRNQGSFHQQKNVYQG